MAQAHGKKSKSIETVSVETQILNLLNKYLDKYYKYAQRRKCSNDISQIRKYQKNYKNINSGAEK